MKRLDIQPNKVQKKKQSGFTLVELMIATMVFAVILLVVSATVVRFTNNFQKGMIESATQNTTRSIVDTISQSLQFNDATEKSTYYCVGTTKYEFTKFRQLDDTPGATALVEKMGTGADCSGPGTTTQELLSTHMRLSFIKITKDESASLPTYTVTVKVAYGDDEVFVGTTENTEDPICDPNVQLHFCAVRELSATVQRRL